MSASRPYTLRVERPGGVVYTQVKAIDYDEALFKFRCNHEEVLNVGRVVGVGGKTPAFEVLFILTPTSPESAPLIRRAVVRGQDKSEALDVFRSVYPSRLYTILCVDHPNP